MGFNKNPFFRSQPRRAYQRLPPSDNLMPLITGIPLSTNFSKVFLRIVRKEEYMGHENGNEVEPGLKKKSART
jgi:hypothetical protein